LIDAILLPEARWGDAFAGIRLGTLVIRIEHIIIFMHIFSVYLYEKKFNNIINNTLDAIYTFHNKFCLPVYNTYSIRISIGIEALEYRKCETAPRSETSFGFYITAAF